MKKVTGIGGIFFDDGKCSHVDKIKSYDYGKFVQIVDMEGNKVPLWEAKDGLQRNCR